MKIKIMLLQLILLLIVFAIFYIFVGPALAIIFTIVWIDKSLLPLLKFTGYIGFELTTIPIILVGIIYGPVFGFIFAFLIVALIGGILNLLSWKISSPLAEITWPPIIPSPDHFADGVTAVVAALTINSLPFLGTILLCSIVKNFYVAIKDKFTLGFINHFPRILSVIINFAIAFHFREHFLAMISL